jgi:hypothetical protein
MGGWADSQLPICPLPICLFLWIPVAQTYLYINDSGGNTWQVAVSDGGVLSQDPVSQQSPAAIHLNDAATNSTSWLLAVTTAGVLELQTATYSSAYPTGITLISPSGYIWILETTSSGVLQTWPFAPEEDFLRPPLPWPPDYPVTVWI